MCHKAFVKQKPKWKKKKKCLSLKVSFVHGQVQNNQQPCSFIYSQAHISLTKQGHELTYTC